MFGKFNRSFALVGASWKLVMQNKRAIIFPLLSSIGVIGVLAVMFAPSFISALESADSQAAVSSILKKLMPPDKGATNMEYVNYGVTIFSLYFVNYFVIIFFNVALVASTLFYMEDGEFSVSRGLGAATKRLPQIVSWSLLSSTVGVLLAAIELSNEKAGRFVSWLLGTLWAVATFFVIPSLVIEGKGPIATFKNSSKMLRETWGDQLVINFWFGWIPIIGMLLAGGVLFGAFSLGAESAALAASGVVLAVLIMVLTMLLTATAKQVFRAALYVHAKYGKVPAGFDENMLTEAFMVSH